MRLLTKIAISCGLALAILLLRAPQAAAQLSGDLFLAVPSMAVPEGGTGELSVLVFAGAGAVGAAHIEVRFDPAAMEIAADDPTTGGFATASTAITGGLGIA